MHTSIACTSRRRSHPLAPTLYMHTACINQLPAQHDRDAQRAGAGMCLDTLPWSHVSDHTIV